MSNEGHIILACGAPAFSDGGDFLLCQLKSGSDTWTFGIRWSDSELAGERFGKIMDAHRAKARNVAAFGKPERRKGDSPPAHG